jgi:hypothetical protein
MLDQFSCSRLFGRYLPDVVGWSKKQKDTLTQWKDMTLHHDVVAGANARS